MSGAPVSVRRLTYVDDTVYVVWHDGSHRTRESAAERVAEQRHALLARDDPDEPKGLAQVDLDILYRPTCNVVARW